MKILGVDYGTKRIGIAISDENATLASPREVLPNDKNIISKILNILNTEQIEEIVFGESLNQNGENNSLAEKVDDFILDLGKVWQGKIHKEKEFFTSFEAHGRMGKERNNARTASFGKVENLDAKAAAIILQRYLEKRNLQINK
ncbi:MAG: Holliday junction resolvase RuvX [Candidatus Paceibacterota bacterium]